MSINGGVGATGLKLKHVSAGGRGWERSPESYRPICETPSKCYTAWAGYNKQAAHLESRRTPWAVAQHTATERHFKFLLLSGQQSTT